MLGRIKLASALLWTMRTTSGRRLNHKEHAEIIYFKGGSYLTGLVSTIASFSFFSFRIMGGCFISAIRHAPFCFARTACVDISPREIRSQMTRMSISTYRPSVRTLVSVAACSAILGPLLDNYHSQFGVLMYTHPIEMHMNIAGVAANLTTSAFTSPLFVLAGLIIAYGSLSLNSVVDNPKFPVRSMSVPYALTTISAFSTIYYLSALLPRTELAVITGPLLTVFAFAEWYWMDRSVGGLVMGLLTGICGPMVEVGLINIAHMYSYSSPEIAGIPLFIAPVYFAGGSAVGNLARAVEERSGKTGKNGKS